MSRVEAPAVVRELSLRVPPADTELSVPIAFWRTTWARAAGRLLPADTEALATAASFGDVWMLMSAESARTGANQTLHAFLHGIPPRYDDPHNCRGGHFKMRPHTVASAHSLWNFLTISLCLEQIPELEHVCGASLAKRARNTYVQLWFRDSKNRAVVHVLQQWLAATAERWFFRCQMCPHKCLLATLQWTPFAVESPPLPMAGPPVFAHSPYSIPGLILNCHGSPQPCLRTASGQLNDSEDVFG
eukprot:TRINITY_DN5705_c0_g1_i1.p1 TRINITY_DN5705_c0_g1~~TRINITY_DN5705_c0_g1_i1.p1  ORF type:complete len:245 (+),score=14.73 TRINITY_DN5705_c0_g1_i1:72-806(+)